jgi:hypothetical protein
MPMPPVTLSRCLTDLNLFGPHFKGKSWAAWKVFLAALFAETANPGDLDVYRERTSERRGPRRPLPRRR